jgi:hypothetical protein
VAINPSALANINSALMPAQVTDAIFSKASETSAVMSLARRVPLAMNANTVIPVPMDVPVPDWVVEGGVKPASQVGTGVKQMQGKKVALIVPVSDEVVATNPSGVIDQLRADLPTGIARAFDYAAINGKSLRTGGAGPFGDYLANCSSTVALGTAAQANGGLYADIVTGAGKVIDKNFDFTGIAADPRFKIDAQLQTDTQGRPLFVDAHSTSTGSVVNGGELAGYPASFNQGVSGKYWRAGDSVQTVTINGTPTGGTFTLSSGGNSASIAYNAAAATVQTAIQAWGGVYATVTVSGSAGGPYTITFPAISSGVAAGVRCVHRQPVLADRRHRRYQQGHRRRLWRRRHRLAAPRHRWRLDSGRLRRRHGDHRQGVGLGVLLRRHRLALRVPGEPDPAPRRGVLRLRHGQS